MREGISYGWGKDPTIADEEPIYSEEYESFLIELYDDDRVLVFEPGTSEEVWEGRFILDARRWIEDYLAEMDAEAEAASAPEWDRAEAEWERTELRMERDDD